MTNIRYGPTHGSTIMICEWQTRQEKVYNHLAKILFENSKDFIRMESMAK